MKLTKLLTHVRSGLWFVPLLYAMAGLVLHTVTITIDRSQDYHLVPADWVGGPDAALAILGTVAASMISLIATVLAITMVVVQLAMAQFSPRIVQTFLEDKPSQNAIGLFVATFVHAILTMREVLVSEDEPVIPGLSVLVVFVMVLVDIVVLVVYVHHIGRALRVSALIELVGKNTRALLDDVYPDSLDEEPERDPHLVAARKSGVLSIIGHDHLVEVARLADARIELVPALGQFVPAGSPLARLHGATVEDVDLDRLHGSVTLSLERTLDQDVAFGLRMLVDMGVKAVSESPYSDPTTTVQVIDRVHDVLRHLARREFPDGVSRDEEGVVRLVVPSMDWQAYVRMSFEELRLAGSGSPQVARRIRAALEDLQTVAPADRQGPLRDQLALLDDRIDQVVEDERDAATASEPDAQGLGVAAGTRQT